VFGGIIGLGVDAASGAINKYPDQITVAMIPDRSCRQTPRTSSRLKPQEAPEQ
jgi:phosphoketolase